MGIGHAPEGRRIFGRMSVRENLEMGLYAQGRGSGSKATEALDRVYALFPILQERKNQAGGTLSGGQQQMLAIGRALMTRPTILMLDEPSMGLAPNLVEKIFEIIVAINGQGTTVLLIEQNAHMALSVANRGYVIESGQIVLEDDAKALLGNDQVRKAYLGEDVTAPVRPIRRGGDRRRTGRRIERARSPLEPLAPSPYASVVYSAFGPAQRWSQATLRDLRSELGSRHDPSGAPWARTPRASGGTIPDGLAPLGSAPLRAR